MKNCIYIPGLGEAFSEQNAAQYVERLKNAMDINDPEPANKYDTKQEKIQYGDNPKYAASTLTLTRTKGETCEEICRVFEFDYKPTLLDEYKNKNIFYRSFLLALV